VAVCGFRAIIVVWREPSKNSPATVDSKTIVDVNIMN